MTFRSLPNPRSPGLQNPYGILITGIGGTGVITIGQIVGMAAHLEGKGVSVLDMSGLAQKYGAVMSHVQVAARPQDLNATRIDTGGASLVVGCDLVVTASTEAIAKMAPSRHARGGERERHADRGIREEPELAAAGLGPAGRHPRGRAGRPTSSPPPSSPAG